MAMLVFHFENRQLSLALADSYSLRCRIARLRMEHFDESVSS
jgi:hypothetical protein